MARVSLPEDLQYLQPVLRRLSKLAAEELNADLDSSFVIRAIRKRIAGLSGKAARQRLEEDRQDLQAWLEGREDPETSGGWWVLGVFSSLQIPGGFRQLVEPHHEPVAAPVIGFEPPSGWRVKEGVSGLDLSRGRAYVASIRAVDAEWIEVERRQRTDTVLPPDIEMTATHAKVRFGPVHGTKHTFTQTRGTPHKHVDYCLEVPGGAVVVTVDSDSSSFDETPLETQLHTLKVMPPPTDDRA